MVSGYKHFAPIGAKRISIVFVNFLLQIETSLAESTHNNIGADARFTRHVASRIVNANVSRIVTSCNFGLFDCGIDKLFELW
jgi:hypothetical protein